MEVLKKCPDLLNLVKKVTQEQGIENSEIVEVRPNGKGEGFLSEVFMVTVKDSITEKQLDLVIKAALTNEQARKSLSIVRCFENECNFYSKVYPTFKNFERSKGILDQIEILPKCYKVSLDNNNQEMLCFENLISAKFELFDKKLVLDHDHVSLIFKMYGRFHAYSVALRDQQPEEYQKLVEGLHNMMDEMSADKTEMFCAHMREYQKLARTHLISGEDDEIIKKFEKYNGDGIVDSFRNIVTQSCDYPVIVHGDCWSNNMMFKYETTKTGRKVSEMRLLDLQLAKEGSPVCDLSYVLYSGADKTIWDNLDEYLRIYYNSFSSFLKQCGSDPVQLFPFEALKVQWRKYSKFGMFMAVLVIKMKLTDQDKIQDFSEGIDTELLETQLNSNFDEKGYQQRIRDLLHHMSDIDAL